MARFVRSYDQMQIFKQTSAPTVASNDLKIGDIWIDTTTDADVKVCTAADTFVTLSEVGGTVGAITATSINFGNESLSTYDEGTWTPAPRGSTTAGAPTGTLAGKYIKIGKKVILEGRISFSSLDTMAGNFIIGGLPFTCVNASSGRGVMSVGVKITWTNDFPVSGLVVQNTTDIDVYNAELDNTLVTITDLAATSHIYFSVFYEATT